MFRISTPELEVDFLDGPGSENYLLASLSIGSRDNWMRCAVDTGASQSISLGLEPGWISEERRLAILHTLRRQYC